MSEQLEVAKCIRESMREHIESLRDEIERMNEEIQEKHATLERVRERAAVVDYKIELMERGREI